MYSSCDETLLRASSSMIFLPGVDKRISALYSLSGKPLSAQVLPPRYVSRRTVIVTLKTAIKQPGRAIVVHPQQLMCKMGR